jgi:hypothetical protein
MASPCPRCGAIKTESVRHGIIYHLFWSLGYHLRRCSQCDRWRVFRRGRSRAELEEVPVPNSGADSSLEVGGESPPEKGAGTAGGGEREAATAREEGSASAEGDEAYVPADWEDSPYDYGCCPKCGSTLYRRSHRTSFERLIGRPRMARCLKCGHRFPYPS